MSKADRTRDYIIRKAAPVFNTKGVAGTSLNDLIEVTGLTKGSIYGNFENKDEVAVAAYDFNLAQINATWKSRMDTAPTAPEKLLAIVAFYKTDFRKVVLSGGCPVMNTAVDADDCHPALKKRVAQSMQAWRKNIETVLHDGISRREIRKGVDVPAFATLFLSLIEGGILFSKTTGDMSFMNHCLAHIEHLVDQELLP